MGHIIVIGGSYGGSDRCGCIPEYMIRSAKNEHPVITVLPTGRSDEYDESLESPENKYYLDNGCSEVRVLKVMSMEPNDPKIRETILTSDIVFATSGNLKNIMEHWTRTHTDDVLREAYQKGIVLAGSSAGAMSLCARGYDDCGLDHSKMFVDALGIIPICFCPHYDDATWKDFNVQVKQQRLCGVAAENGIALEYKDGKYAIIKERNGSAFFFDAENGHKKYKLTESASRLNKDAKFLSKLDK